MNEDIFRQAVKDWVEHCEKPEVKFSSSMLPVRNCKPYKTIVSLGFEALPLIRKLYDENSSQDFALSIVQGHGLVDVVKEIVGEDFSIPEEIKGRISAIEDYTKTWLDENIPKYVPTK